MESKMTVHKRNACSFRHDENKRGSHRSHPLLLQNFRRKATGKSLRKERLSEAGVRLRRNIEDRAKNASVGNARPIRVIHGIFPCIRITKPNRAGSSVKSAFLHREVDSQPKNRPKKTGGKRFCCHVEEFQAIRLRLPGYRASEIQFDFHGRAHNLWDQSTAFNS